MSLNDPNWGRQGGSRGPGGNQGPPDLDELWRNFNRKLNDLFGKRKPPGAGERLTLPEHERDKRYTRHEPPSEHEVTLRGVAPELGDLVALLRKRHGGQALRNVKRLHKIWVDYPTDAVIEAVRVAVAHDLIDLERIERMVLQRIAGDFFRLPVDHEDNDRDPEDEDPEPEGTR